MSLYSASEQQWSYSRIVIKKITNSYFGLQVLIHYFRSAIRLFTVVLNAENHQSSNPQAQGVIPTFGRFQEEAH